MGSIRQIHGFAGLAKREVGLGIIDQEKSATLGCRDMSEVETRYSAPSTEEGFINNIRDNMCLHSARIRPICEVGIGVQDIVPTTACL